MNLQLKEKSEWFMNNWKPHIDFLREKGHIGAMNYRSDSSSG